MLPRLLLALVAIALIAGGAADARADEPRWLGPRPAAAPARVVTLAPSITDIVLELGKRQVLVGVSRHDDAKDVEGLPRVGTFLEPAPEAILALAPELIVAQPSGGNRGAVERLAQLGVPVLVLPLGTVNEVLASTRAVGAALGDPAGGESLAAKLEKGIAGIRAASARLPRRSALLVYQWKPLVVAGPGSFAHELLLAAGGENAASGASGAYPTLSAEAALAARPDLILDATGGHGGGAPLPGLSSRVVKLASPGLFQPGPRLLEGLREMAAILHPAVEGSP